MLKRLREKNKKGFTLIELMIVIAIIGILAAIAIPQFSAYRIRAYNTSALSDTRNLVTTQAAFYSDWEEFGVSGNRGDSGVGAVRGRGVLITGPGDPERDGVATLVDGKKRFLATALGKDVSLVAHTDDRSISFTGGAKHLHGNTIYGTDSDTTSLFQNPDTRKAGDKLEEGDMPASTHAKDDFTDLDPWVVK